MSWSAGSELFSDIITSLKHRVPPGNIRKKIYKDLIRIFENMDCDSLDDCKGEDKYFDEAYNEYIREEE